MCTQSCFFTVLTKKNTSIAQGNAKVLHTVGILLQVKACRLLGSL